MTVAGETISELNGESDFGCEIFVLRPVKKSIDDEDSGVNECTASFYWLFSPYLSEEQAVSKWESEQSTPDLEKVIAMSELFDVTTDCILKGIEPVSTTNRYPLILISHNIAEPFQK